MQILGSSMLLCEAVNFDLYKGVKTHNLEQNATCTYQISIKLNKNMYNINDYHVPKFQQKPTSGEHAMVKFVLIVEVQLPYTDYANRIRCRAA